MMSGRGRAALMLVVVALCSGLAGAAIERLVVQRYFRRPPGRPSPEQQAEHRREMLDEMSKVLDLTPPQRAGIDSIMKRTDSTLRAIRHEMQPRTIAEFESSRNEIIARLDSAQRVKFAKIPKRSPPGFRR
ncbi:MAG: hypothetical protein JWM95_73 [Gemmatimonadetes bacterium]|nr:hypothetical protein [Gemmatimonadota bacterium]